MFDIEREEERLQTFIRTADNPMGIKSLQEYIEWMFDNTYDYERPRFTLTSRLIRAFCESVMSQQRDVRRAVGILRPELHKDPLDPLLVLEVARLHFFQRNYAHCLACLALGSVVASHKEPIESWEWFEENLNEWQSESDVSEPNHSNTLQQKHALEDIGLSSQNSSQLLMNWSEWMERKEFCTWNEWHSTCEFLKGVATSLQETRTLSIWKTLDKRIAAWWTHPTNDSFAFSLRNATCYTCRLLRCSQSEFNVPDWIPPLCLGFANMNSIIEHSKEITDEPFGLKEHLGVIISNEEQRASLHKPVQVPIGDSINIVYALESPQEQKCIGILSILLQRNRFLSTVSLTAALRPALPNVKLTRLSNNMMSLCSITEERSKLSPMAMAVLLKQGCLLPRSISQKIELTD